jgi:hypothetical protein
VLHDQEFQTEEHNWPVILSNYYSKLFAGGVCVNLNDFGIVCIGQDQFFCNSSLYVIECSLMDFFSVPGYLFGSFCFDYFGLTALSN